MRENKIDLPKSTHEVIRVQVQEYKGTMMLSIRVWFKDESGEMRPGKQGINVKMDKATPIAQAIMTVVARHEAEKLGLTAAE